MDAGSETMNGTELALQLLPARYLDLRCRERLRGAEELRFRIGQAPMMLLHGSEIPFADDLISENDLLRILEKATGASLHTAAPALSRGYISFHGLRIGVCGSAVIQNGQLSGFRSYTSLAVRIPRECRGVCDGVLRQLNADGIENLLIISSPGGGKTTALREIVRALSSRGRRIGLIDERCEIAACDAGRPQFALGAHCDVLSGLDKRAGSMMLLRGMNPEIIAMDEISQAEDLEAVREIIGCGVGLIATAHAAELEDLKKRPLYRLLLDEQVFSRLLIIRMEQGERQYDLRRLGNENRGTAGGDERVPLDRLSSDHDKKAGAAPP